MKIYAIGDLHLSFDAAIEKPMDIYGGQWVRHTERLKENWVRMVKPEDVVMVAGDISWGLKMSEATADLDWIEGLPGRKVMIKGNHDLWWTSTGRLNKMYDTIYFIQNNFYPAGDLAICGSRGWVCPGSDEFKEHDEKIYKRELLRLEFSLEAAASAGFKHTLAMVHFPPTNDKLQPSGFTRLFEKYKVKKVVYGHLHGEESFPKGISGNLNGVEYKLVALDYLKTEPHEML